jgi:hypothetical protein
VSIAKAIHFPTSFLVSAADAKRSRATLLDVLLMLSERGKGKCTFIFLLAEAACAMA